MDNHPIAMQVHGFISRDSEELLRAILSAKEALSTGVIDQEPIKYTKAIRNAIKHLRWHLKYGGFFIGRRYAASWRGDLNQIGTKLGKMRDIQETSILMKELSQQDTAANTTMGLRLKDISETLEQHSTKMLKETVDIAFPVIKRVLGKIEVEMKILEPAPIIPLDPSDTSKLSVAYRFLMQNTILDSAARALGLEEFLFCDNPIKYSEQLHDIRVGVYGIRRPLDLAGGKKILDNIIKPVLNYKTKKWIKNLRGPLGDLHDCAVSLDVLDKGFKSGDKAEIVAYVEKALKPNYDKILEELRKNWPELRKGFVAIIKNLGRIDSDFMEAYHPQLG